MSPRLPIFPISNSCPIFQNGHVRIRCEPETLRVRERGVSSGVSSRFPPFFQVSKRPDGAANQRAYPLFQVHAVDNAMDFLGSTPLTFALTFLG